MTSIAPAGGHLGGAGAVGAGEPSGDRGPVLAESLAEPAQLADRAGLGPAGPGFEVLAAAVTSMSANSGGNRSNPGQYSSRDMALGQFMGCCYRL